MRNIFDRSNFLIGVKACEDLLVKDESTRDLVNILSYVLFAFLYFHCFILYYFSVRILLSGLFTCGHTRQDSY